MWLMLLSTKDEDLAMFTTFKARAEAKAGRKVGTLRTDHGREFTVCGFTEYCSEHGVQ
jgi:hypothetical protein